MQQIYHAKSTLSASRCRVPTATVLRLFRNTGHMWVCAQYILRDFLKSRGSVPKSEGFSLAGPPTGENWARPCQGLLQVLVDQSQNRE